MSSPSSCHIPFHKDLPGRTANLRIWLHEAVGSALWANKSAGISEVAVHFAVRRLSVLPFAVIS
jgi:hypothetical protein